MLSWEEGGVFQGHLPVLAFLALHHKVIRVVWHLALAISSHTNPQGTPLDKET
jgi:hypothetical protein